MKKIFLIICTALLLSGCNGILKPEEPKKVTLKVIYESESAFFMNYGSLLSVKFPNIDYRVIPLPNINNYSTNEEYLTAYNKIIDEQQPDILTMFPDEIDKYANMGYLYDLDSLITQDKYDIDKQLPTVVDYIRSIGSGKLFALTPNFYAMAVYYNKELFDRYGIPYPKDNMSWEELFQLARRFPSESDSISGIMFNSKDDMFQIAIDIGVNQNLKYLDLANKKITINSSSWKKIFQLVFDAYEAKSIYQRTDFDEAQPGMTRNEVVMKNPFIANKVAMTIEGNYFLNELKIAATADSKLPQRWDVVSFPTNGDQFDSDDSMWVQLLFAINSKSANVKEAWETIKYINSDEFTRVSMKSTLSDSLPIRRDLLPSDGHNLDAFYKSTMKPYISKKNVKISKEFLPSFYSFAEKQVQEAYKGNITLDDMLLIIEQKGQEMLHQSVDTLSKSTP